MESKNPDQPPPHNSSRADQLLNALRTLAQTQESRQSSSRAEPAARGGSSTGSAATSSSASDAAKLPLSIRTLDGKTFKIQDAKTDWTVKRLKEEFAEWQGQGWNNVLLQYKGKRLNDNELLSKYNIEPHSIVLANYRSKGGIIMEKLCFVSPTREIFTYFQCLFFPATYSKATIENNWI